MAHNKACFKDNDEASGIGGRGRIPRACSLPSATVGTGGVVKWRPFALTKVRDGPLLPTRYGQCLRE